FFGVRRLLEVLGEVDPVVLVVDDIQWAQSLFLDLLEHLAEWVSGVPVLIVALARPEIREVRTSFAEEGRRIAAVVSLEGLDSSATRELAARLLDADDLPAGVLERIPDSTEGNPLFVREVVRMLVDDGVLVLRDHAWELAIDLDAVEVPPTVTALLASRVDRLEPDERRVLELASVVGSEFPIGVLVDVQDTSRTALAPVLERMRRKELVEPTGAYLGDDPLFRFHHVLIREAAYRRLLKGTRAELHQAVGEWTEAAAERLVGDFDVTIGNHFEQARSYRLALDLDDAETVDLARRAAEAFTAAANRALDQEDLEAAGSLATRALSMLADTDDGIAELLVLGCEALLSVGRVADAQPLIDRFGSVAEGDDRLTAWHACFAAELVVLSDPGGVGEAERRAAAAAETLGALDDTRGVAKAHLVRAAALVRLGQVGACEAELDRALTAARSADDRRRVTSVLGAAPMAALWGPSPVPRAGGRCLDVIRLLRITTASPAVEATSVRCQGLLEALRGRFDAARSMLDQARETVVELGLGHAVSQVDLYRGIAELLADDPVAAERHLRDAYRGLGSLGIGADAGQAASYLARSLLAQSRLDEAEDLVHEADALAGQNPQTAIIGRSVHAEVLAARGEFGEALLLADEAVTLAGAGDILFDHANAVAAQARVHALAGDTDSAAEAAAEAAALYEQKGATVEVGLAIATPSHDRAAPLATETPADAGALPEAWTNSSVWEIGQRWADAHNADDLDAALALVHPDLVVDDRRFILGAEADDLGVQHEFSLLADPAIGVEFEVLDVRGDDLGLGKVTVSTRSDRSTWEWLAMLRVHDGLMAEAIVFPLEDLAEARAELDRMAGEQPRTSAEEVAGRAYALIGAGDFDAAMALTAPDIRFVDRRPVVGVESADVGFREMSRNIANPRMGLTVELVDRLGDEVVAYRGQMATAGGTAAWEWVAIWHVVNGLAIEVVLVDPEDEDGLRREMERLAASSGAFRSPAVEVVERVFAAIEQDDAEAAVGLWHPDAVLDDRRFVAGSESADEGAEAQLRRMSHPSTSYRAELLDYRGDELCLYRAVVATRSGRAEWGMVSVYRVVAGQVVHAIGFDADQEDEARAELDRLAASPTAALGNSASVVVDRMTTAVDAGDVETAVEFWHPDCMFEDRLFLLNAESVEVGMIERTRLVAADESVSVRGELLDHRGDDLCLFRIVTTARSGRAEWEYIAIDRVVAGKIVHAILLDSSAEAEARAELDRLAALSPAAAVIDRKYRALAHGQIAAASALNNPDIRYEDRRFILAGESEDVGLRSWGERLVEPGVSVEAELVEVAGDHVVVCRVLMSATARGTEWTWLAVWRVEDGLAADLVLFDVDDLDGALAEAQSLAAGADDAGWALLRACHRALVDCDVEGAVATMHPEIRWADRRLLGSLSDGVGPAELLKPAAHTSLSHGHELIDSRNGAYLFRRWLERDDGNEWVWLAVARVEDGLIT
ncbi:MAG: nuclear transport factor 2 family protein, partial [Actinomycetota bacterium]